VFALIKAILAHLYLVWIHPFGDGNGRTARLLEFRILLSASIPWPVAHLLSNHYNLTRSEYYRILSASSRKKNGELLFLRYSVLGLRDQLKEQLELIWDQVWDVTWRNIVHENFSGENESLQRKRKLLLDLSVFQKKPDNEWVELSKLPNVSPRVARHYSKRTYRTVKRDVIDLIQKDFLKTNKGLFAVNRELILRFLPLRREE